LQRWPRGDEIALVPQQCPPLLCARCN